MKNNHLLHITAFMALLLSFGTGTAQNLIDEGEYRVYATIDNVNYFLTDNGVLTIDTLTGDDKQIWKIAPYQSTSGSELEKVAYTFINKKTGNFFEDGGHLQGYDEGVWTSHAVYFDDAAKRYAIRVTNYNGNMYSSDNYVTVFGGFLDATSYTTPQYVWNIRKSTDEIYNDIHLSKAGTLGDYMEEYDETIVSLRITGSMDGTDFAILRKMQAISSLDLSDVTIVSGGSPYVRSFVTADNEIGDSMFTGMPFKKILLPENVTKIGGYAFRNCTSLTSVVVSQNITSIGRYAFLDCTSLDTVEYLSPNCNTDCYRNGLYYPPFKGCPLSSVTIGNNVRHIPDALFWDAGHSFSFKQITLPPALISIGDYAFYRCGTMTQLTIPEGVSSLGRGAFAGCAKIMLLNYNASDCEAAYIDSGFVYYPFNGCSFNAIKIASTVRRVPEALFVNSSSSSSVTLSLSEGIERIDDYAFSGLKMLTARLPKSLTYMGRNAFYACTSLKSVYYQSKNCEAGWVSDNDSTYYPPFKLCPLTYISLGDSVESVPEGLFWNSANSFVFTSINLPGRIESIGKRAFRECVNVKRVTCYSEVPLDIDFNVFYTLNLEDCSLIVPQGSASRYKAAYPWNLFGTIEEK